MMIRKVRSEAAKKAAATRKANAATTPVMVWIYNAKQAPKSRKFANVAKAREWVTKQIATDRIRVYEIATMADKQICVFNARGRG
jgi:hypothetical protein